MGLYEAYWGVPDGPFTDFGLEAGKAVPWIEVAKIVEELLIDGNIRILFVSEGVNGPIDTDISKIVYNKANWEPFDISVGPGYLLTDGGENRQVYS